MDEPAIGERPALGSPLETGDSLNIQRDVLLRIFHNHSHIVHGPTGQACTRELGPLEMRAGMESVCTKFAEKRMDASQREEFRSTLRACLSAAKSNNQQGYTKANSRFHAAIYAGARKE